MLRCNSVLAILHTHIDWQLAITVSNVCVQDWSKDCTTCVMLKSVQHWKPILDGQSKATFDHAILVSVSASVFVVSMRLGRLQIAPYCSFQFGDRDHLSIIRYLLEVSWSPTCPDQP